MYVFTFFLVVSIPLGLSKDAVEYFVMHKKIKHASIKILENGNNSTRWIEYQYIFENIMSGVNIPDKLKVGIFTNMWMKYDFMGCRLLEKQNKTVPSGYDVAVFRDLQKILKVSTEFILIKNLTQIASNGIDLVICHPDSLDLPSNVVELHPIVKSKLMMIYKPSKLHFTKDIFILTFAGSLWVVFFTIMIFLAVCLRISTRKYSTIKSNYESWTWVEITLWAIAAACQQGLSHTPSGFASCLIFFLGYLMAYLLYTGFAAAITSILVENIESTVDLKHIRLDKLHLISTKCTEPHIKQFRGRFLVTDYVSDLKTLFDELEKENRIGIGPQISLQQYMANNFDYEKIATYKSMKVNIIFAKGFLTLQNNPWHKIINKHLIALDESGILQNIFQKNVRPAPALNLKSGYSSAGQEHVGSAILLFLGGVSTSVLFFLAELVVSFYKKGRNQSVLKN